MNDEIEIRSNCERQMSVKLAGVLFDLSFHPSLLTVVC